ncbi:hypothetical protein QFC22_002697 [Naganishia vaughanmartiniae]|uniref:Uncharacterized protein n=1 Tax=Naganishia vaughanmartiniae TaxID=1424756 RepID=A0ACC2XBI0_9TREE|nr:hypothetical protein QFC22_002697 [Naganishia vaughanmartiniae]
MTKATEPVEFQTGNGHMEQHKNGGVSAADIDQKHEGSPAAPATIPSESGTASRDHPDHSRTDNAHASSSPVYEQKSGDGEDEDYDPYPYGSTLSPSFNPQPGEGVAQSQSEQVAMLQHHQSAQHPKLQGKGKDLSHVPCRFFKVGGCTAGLACPFSHSLTESALAHIKPGEEYTMDRENKKAAQRAAQKEKADKEHNGDSMEEFPPAHVNLDASRRLKSPGKNGRDKDRKGSASIAVPISDSSKQANPVHARFGASYSDKLKAASAKVQAIDGKGGKKTADGNVDGSPRKLDKDSAMPVAVPARKISIVKDMVAQAHSISPGSRHRAMLNAATNSGGLSSSPHSPFGTSPRPSGSANILAAKLPGPETENFKSRSLSVPGPIAVAATLEAYTLPDPIGTPPREGFRGYLNSGSAALAGGLSTSPFSAPGHRSAFPASISTGQRLAGEHLSRPPLTSLTHSSDGSLSMQANRIISSSVVGAEFGPMGRDIWGHRTTSFSGGMLSPPSHTRPPLPDRRDSDVFALDDEDDEDNGEDFLPSSLSELLTPRERARRMSRHNSNQQSGSVGVSMGWSATPPTTAGTPQVAEFGSSWDARLNPDHFLNRQAQSAGAVAGGFLQSLWDDAGEDVRKTKPVGNGGGALGLNNGDGTIKASELSGSNGQSSGLSSMFASRGQRTVLGSPPATAPVSDTGFTLGPSSASVAFLPQFGPRTSTLLDTGSRGNHSPSRPSPLHHYTQADGKHQLKSATSSRFVSANAAPTSASTIRGEKLTSGFAAIAQPVVSPSLVALQSHAPGQSLPQGLAAGLSRIHLQPIQRTSTATSSLTLSTSPSGSTMGINPIGAEYEKSGKAQIGSTALAEVAWGLPTKPYVLHTGGSQAEEEDMFEMDG